VLLGKIVIVTGGANGIGKEIVRTFSANEAIVVIVDIDRENGEKLALETHAHYYFCDIKIKESIEALYKWVMEQFNKCDILINNAGVSLFKSIYELSIEEFDEIIDVNLRGPFLMSQGFAKLNRETTYGRIINISSTRYLMSEASSEAYAASKGGIVSLTHALALSLSEANITVNCISPGWIETGLYSNLKESDHKQHPSQRVGIPSDIARMCLFLCDEKNNFINGENIVIDGGMTRKMKYED